ncbi:MAG: transposase [Planctomycetaceae bacterium]|nr:transposase [Planctomycetaceae bacterium]
MKGTRWLLLKNPENLKNEKEEKEEQKRLNKALELNKPLATAYYLIRIRIFVCALNIP